jgi:nucleoid-associated protein YgaU
MANENGEYDTSAAGDAASNTANAAADAAKAALEAAEAAIKEKIEKEKAAAEKLKALKDRLKKKIQSVRQSQLNEFGVLHTKEFPASTCSVNDLRTYLKKAEEVLGLKFDNIFVDYINIMKNWRNANSENTYMKIKQIADAVIGMLSK